MAGDLRPAAPVRTTSCEGLARILGVNPKTVARWAKERRIPYYRVARTLRFDVEAVLRALAVNPDDEAGPR